MSVFAWWGVQVYVRSTNFQEGEIPLYMKLCYYFLLENYYNNIMYRYGISHPVVNDESIELWERLGVTCWPTLVIIGPNCQLLHYIIGEGHGAELQLFMDVAVEYYKGKGQLSKDDVPMCGTTLKMKEKDISSLKYPGKVCLDQSHGHLFIADSSHHRILAADWKTGKDHSVCL